MKPRFFTTPTHFRDWLAEHHETSSELLVGFHKKESGKPSITYPEALDEALCFGWIDGVRKRLNETSYTIRFTPRKPKSIWSLINVGHIERLKKEKRMMPPGLKAFEAREAKRTGVYAFENAPRELSPEYQKLFQRTKQGWEFFQQLPSYVKRTSAFWVMSAKKEETRARRLAKLIDSSAKGIRLY